MENVIIVNFKTYESATGNKAVELAKMCEEVARKSNKQIIIAVQDVDLFRVAQSVGIEVWAEHVDPQGFGSNTGHDIPEALVANDAKGVLINHSEDQVPLRVIEEVVRRCKAVGLKTCVCANTADIAKQVAAFNPDMIAVEPPELIGGDVSVTTADPDIVKQTVLKVHSVDDIPVLCGAGVKTKDDVKMAIKLGAKGVLLASGVTKAADPKQVLLDLAKGL